MVRFKACPRCHGDLILERELDGTHWSCLQCGGEYPVRYERPALAPSSVTQPTRASGPTPARLSPEEAPEGQGREGLAAA